MERERRGGVDVDISNPDVARRPQAFDERFDRSSLAGCWAIRFDTSSSLSAHGDGWRRFAVLDSCNGSDETPKRLDRLAHGDEARTGAAIEVGHDLVEPDAPRSGASTWPRDGIRRRASHGSRGATPSMAAAFLMVSSSPLACGPFSPKARDIPEPTETCGRGPPRSDGHTRALYRGCRGSRRRGERVQRRTEPTVGRSVGHGGRA